jgi:hypothetical protein
MGMGDGFRSRVMVGSRGAEELGERGNKVVVDQLIELFEDEIIVDRQLRRRRRRRRKRGLKKLNEVGLRDQARIIPNTRGEIGKEDRLGGSLDVLPGRLSVRIRLGILSVGCCKVGGMLEVRMRLGSREASEHYGVLRSCRFIHQWIRRRR